MTTVAADLRYIITTAAAVAAAILPLRTLARSRAACDHVPVARAIDRGTASRHRQSSSDSPRASDRLARSRFYPTEGRENTPTTRPNPTEPSGPNFPNVFLYSNRPVRKRRRSIDGAARRRHNPRARQNHAGSLRP